MQRLRLAEIFRRAHYARQPENRIRRIVRVDDHARTHLVADGTDLLKEEDEIGPQLLGANTFVAVERLLELLQSEALLAAGEAGNHIAGNECNLLMAHRLVPGASPSNLLR